MPLFNKYGIYVLLIFHIIGCTLFLIDKSYAELSYLNLLLSGIVLLFSERKLLNAFGIFLLIWTSGFLIEFIGVQTGILFGNYSYGDALGLKVAGVPLLIGVNWYCIVVASSNLSVFTSNNIYLQAFVSGLLCTVMDYAIEPVAIEFGFWNWRDGEIPFYNYASWFVFAFLFSLLYLKFFSNRNLSAIGIWFIWFLFFIILNIV